MAEALEMAEGRVPGWAASFSMVHQVGLGLSPTFFNPLYQRHEAGSEVLFAPSILVCAAPISLVDNYWATSCPTTVPQATLQNMQGILDAIVALKDQQLRIMEHLDVLSSGVRGQTMGKDMDHPLVASPAIADQMEPLSDALQALFDVLQEASYILAQL